MPLRPPATMTCSAPATWFDRAAADLAHAFEDVVQAVDVRLAEQAAVGVHRQPALELDVAVGDEVARLARPAEARSPPAAGTRSG